MKNSNPSYEIPLPRTCYLVFWRHHSISSDGMALTTILMHVGPFASIDALSVLDVIRTSAWSGLDWNSLAVLLFC